MTTAEVVAVVATAMVGVALATAVLLGRHWGNV